LAQVTFRTKFKSQVLHTTLVIWARRPTSAQ